MAIKLNDSRLAPFVGKNEVQEMTALVKCAHDLIENKEGAGSDFTGFINLPRDYDREEFEDIKKTAEKIRSDSDVLVVIGIGGSYLGARSAIECVKGIFHNDLNLEDPQIYYVGNNMSADYVNDILALCEGKEVSLNVISKSGTTAEPAIAFRIFRKMLEEKYGKEEAAKRIYCTTDKSRGALRATCEKNGYKTFVIPDDVGGRYSSFTPVGLLPMAVAGMDIDAVMSGAFDAMKDFSVCDLEKNAAYRYAAIRNILYNKGKTIEMYTSYDPRFTSLNEWLKQLYGESEGKDQKGIFPASVVNSTDLHSLGQYIQEGRRDMFESVIHVAKVQNDITIPDDDAESGDGMFFLDSRKLSFVNEKAYQGTVLAHTDGGVPSLSIEMPEINEYEYGYLIYFFEKACAISGYLLGVNPFNQPGVEGYKNNMYALLGKPGYEDLAKELEARIDK
ncbi:MAG: glucose-6-phosphate isomerase [Clostridia bacterium]|nr:glucose-6-phosphate isomerase [Clostridia bacterium]